MGLCRPFPVSLQIVMCSGIRFYDPPGPVIVPRLLAIVCVNSNSSSEDGRIQVTKCLFNVIAETPGGPLSTKIEATNFTHGQGTDVPKMFEYPVVKVVARCLAVFAEHDAHNHHLWNRERRLDGDLLVGTNSLANHLFEPHLLGTLLQLCCVRHGVWFQGSIMVHDLCRGGWSPLERSVWRGPISDLELCNDYRVMYEGVCGTLLFEDGWWMKLSQDMLIEMTFVLTPSEVDHLPC